MLYKKICAISLSAASLLTTRTMGANYYVASNSGSDYIYNGGDNRLDIHCNENDMINGYKFDCGNANECYFHCEERKCAESATINATNSDNLYVNIGSSGQECVKGANIYSPNNGNAYFTTFAVKGFKAMNVHSGTNTQSIIIDSSQGQEEKDDCKEMNVYASTADYVKITIGSGQEFEIATVECPVDSTYNGPDIAPCIIDGPNAIMADLNIIAPDGIPHGVYITASTATNVNVTCNNIDNKNGADSDVSIYPFDTESDCWWTKDPTNDPTTSPTSNLTPSSTEHPTDSTKNSTISPTTNSTVSRTTNPTPAPTDNPTLRATKITTNPTGAPTVDPKAPTRDPTEKSLFVPNKATTKSSTTLKPTINTLKSDGNSISNSNTKTAANTMENEESLPVQLIIGIILSVFFFICTTMMVAFCVHKERKKNTNNLNHLNNPHLETVRSDTFDTKSPKQRTRCGDDMETNYDMKPDEFEVIDKGDIVKMDDDKIMDGIHITGGQVSNDQIFTDNVSNMSYNNIYKKKDDFGRMIGDDTMVQTMVMNDILDAMEEDKQYKNRYNNDLDDDDILCDDIHTTAGGHRGDEGNGANDGNGGNDEGNGEGNENDSDHDIALDDIHVTAGGPIIDNNTQYNIDNNNNIIDDIAKTDDDDDDILLSVNEIQITEEGANDVEINDSDDEIVLHGTETWQ